MRVREKKKAEKSRDFSKLILIKYLTLLVTNLLCFHNCETSVFPIVDFVLFTLTCSLASKDHSFCTSLVPERLRVFVIRRILSLWLL